MIVVRVDDFQNCDCWSWCLYSPGDIPWTGNEKFAVQALSSLSTKQHELHNRYSKSQCLCILCQWECLVSCVDCDDLWRTNRILKAIKPKWQVKNHPVFIYPRYKPVRRYAISSERCPEFTILTNPLDSDWTAAASIPLMGSKNTRCAADECVILWELYGIYGANQVILNAADQSQCKLPNARQIWALLLFRAELHVIRHTSGVWTIERTRVLVVNYE